MWMVKIYVWSGRCGREIDEDWEIEKLKDFTGGDARIEFIPPHRFLREYDIDLSGEERSRLLNIICIKNAFEDKVVYILIFKS